MLAKNPFPDDYRPKFSGHETFPMRYGWLKKVYDRVLETECLDENRSSCWGDDAISHFGVGKNMVSSMRHWALASCVIEEPSGNVVKTTDFGRMIFDQNGQDPFMEHPSTLWVIHWNLASRFEKTTWFWAFNLFNAVTFSRETFVKELEALSNRCGWSLASRNTLKNDIACFVRTYVNQTRSTVDEDHLESPLTELGLIKALGNSQGFRFVRGPKRSLSDGVFAYALTEFWSHSTEALTLSFQDIAYGPGSPGRVFLLDENDIAFRLYRLEEATSGSVRWSETAGMKQLVSDKPINSRSIENSLAKIYTTKGMAA